jgi:hypothetical protein
MIDNPVMKIKQGVLDYRLAVIRAQGVFFFKALTCGLFFVLNTNLVLILF